MTTTERVAAYLRTIELRRAQLWHCAETLAVSTSTLDRRLRAEGSTFRAMLAEERRRRALEVLETNPRADLRLMAQHCGFARGTSAHKAFKRFMGMGIRTYRQLGF